MKSISGRVTITIVLTKDVQAEVGDDADDRVIEDSLRSAAMEEAVFEAVSKMGWRKVHVEHAEARRSKGFKE